MKTLWISFWLNFSIAILFLVVVEVTVGLGHQRRVLKLFLAPVVCWHTRWRLLGVVLSELRDHGRLLVKVLRPVRPVAAKIDAKAAVLPLARAAELLTVGELRVRGRETL